MASLATTRWPSTFTELWCQTVLVSSLCTWQGRCLPVTPFQMDLICGVCPFRSRFAVSAVWLCLCDFVMLQASFMFGRRFCFCFCFCFSVFVWYYASWIFITMPAVACWTPLDARDAQQVANTPTQKPATLAIACHARTPSRVHIASIIDQCTSQPHASCYAAEAKLCASARAKSPTRRVGFHG